MDDPDSPDIGMPALPPVPPQPAPAATAQTPAPPQSVVPAPTASRDTSIGTAVRHQTAAARPSLTDGRRSADGGGAGDGETRGRARGEHAQDPFGGGDGNESSPAPQGTGMEARFMPIKRRRMDASVPAEDAAVGDESLAGLGPSPRTVSFPAEESPAMGASNAQVPGALPSARTPGAPIGGTETQAHETQDGGRIVDPVALPPGRNGMTAGRDLLPLDHVMTAVVQATVLILDQRLKPIADRLDDLSEDIRLARERALNNSVVADMVSQQHAEHVELMERMRKEIRKLRSEHRVVIGESIAVKEAELKQYLERTLEQAVSEVMQRCQSAMASTATNAGVDISGTTAPAPGITHNPVEASAPMHQPAPSALPPPMSAPRAAFATAAMVRRASDPRMGSDMTKGGWPSPSSRRYSTPTVGNMNYSNGAEYALKNKVTHIIARQVSIWLLETQHEFDERANQGTAQSAHGMKSVPVAGITPTQERWTQGTVTTCLMDVSNKLQNYKNYDDARRSLSASLGDDNVELGWFLSRASSENLRAARINYSAWDPPPTDDEWRIEENLLHQLSERFHAALAGYRVTGTEPELGTAVSICRVAAMNDSPVQASMSGLGGAQRGHDSGAGLARASGGAVYYGANGVE